MTEEKPDVAPEETVEVAEPTLEQKLAKAEEALQAKDKEIEKFQSKDYNFKRLRDMSEAEKAEYTAKELELKEQSDALEEKQTKFADQVFHGHKNEALAVLAGNDKDLKEKIEHHFNRLDDGSRDKESILSVMREAATLAGAPDTVNPVNRAATYHSGRSAQSPQSDKALTSEQKELGKKMGLSEKDYELLDK